MAGASGSPEETESLREAEPLSAASAAGTVDAAGTVEVGAATRISRSARRKNEHLALARKFYDAAAVNDFDHVHLLRPTLPESSVLPSILKTYFFGQPVEAPFFVNAMTGGSEKTAGINRSLARVAKEQGIAMALGSANIVSHETAALASFAVAREENPAGALLVNVNPSTPVETVRLLIRELKPVALQIHVNAVQEVVMPEGDRDFHWLGRIEAIRDAVEVPVIVKEVGFGFDDASLSKLFAIGISAVDLAGSGGTDFTRIENSRRPARDFGYLDGIGLSTVKSLMNAHRVLVARASHHEWIGPSADASPLFGSGAGLKGGVGGTCDDAPTIIASGGVRNPLDVLKSLALGARYVGISNGFLQTLREEGEEGLNAKISAWKEQLASLLALFGVGSLEEAASIRSYLDAELLSYAEQTAPRP